MIMPEITFTVSLSHIEAHTFMVSYLLLALILGPYRNRTQGIGSIKIERKPKRLVAHAMPSLLYTSVDQQKKWEQFDQHEL